MTTFFPLIFINTGITNQRTVIIKNPNEIGRVKNGPKSPLKRHLLPLYFKKERGPKPGRFKYEAPRMVKPRKLDGVSSSQSQANYLRKKGAATN
jgi:hypothetical protein